MNSQRHTLKLPEGWQAIPLGELGSFQSGGTPSKKETSYWGGNIPFITGADITNFNVYAKEARSFLTKEGLKSGRTAICDPNTILLVTRTCVGNVGIANETMGASQDLSPFNCGPKIHHEFLARYLLSISKQLVSQCRGTSIQGITRDFVRAIEIPLPPLHEQRKIAKILGSVDDVIEKTKAVIAQLKVVKQALLEALLTCGLDSSGHLRNPLKSPHLFKQSPLGLIPKEWEVDKLGSVCARSGGSIQIGPFGSQLHSSDYREEGIPIITVEHLGENEIIHQNLPLVGEEDFKRLKKYHLKTGDLVFSRVGSIDRCAYVSEKEDGWMFSGRCLRVRVGMKLIGSKFLSHQLNNTTHRNWLLKHSVGSTMHCLNTSILSSVPVIIPPLPEQREIVNIITENTQRIMAEERRLDQLEILIIGLMTILLTGSKRVKV